jgi:hypothetical protein
MAQEHLHAPAAFFTPEKTMQDRMFNIMKRNPPSNRAPLRGAILPALLALAVFAVVVDGGPGPASTLRADDSASLETDHAFLDIENWGGSNWQAAG